MMQRVQVVNNCGFPVHLRADQLDEPKVRILQPKDIYSEAYRNKIAYNPATGANSATGVSIKISADSRLNQDLADGDHISVFEASAVTQLEYTFDPSLQPGPDLYYDVSDIDDNSPRQFSVICPPDCQRNLTSGLVNSNVFVQMAGRKSLGVKRVRMAYHLT
ncbi:hypothetical protein HRG_012273 [Hirsutella rhossiliensis]